MSLHSRAVVHSPFVSRLHELVGNVNMISFVFLLDRFFQLKYFAYEFYK